MLTGVPNDKRTSTILRDVFEQLWNTTLATDPLGSKMNPPQLIAPNGTIEEFAKYWMVGKPYYDPSEIAVPTLLIRGEWDEVLPRYQSQALFKTLNMSPTSVLSK